MKSGPLLKKGSGLLQKQGFTGNHVLLTKKLDFVNEYNIFNEKQYFVDEKFVKLKRFLDVN